MLALAADKTNDLEKHLCDKKSNPRTKNSNSSECLRPLATDQKLPAWWWPQLGTRRSWRRWGWRPSWRTWPASCRNFLPTWDRSRSWWSKASDPCQERRRTGRNRGPRWSTFGTNTLSNVFAWTYLCYRWLWVDFDEWFNGKVLNKFVPYSYETILFKSSLPP